MLIEIKHRITQEVIASGEYTSIKDYLERNRGADLEDADLRDADLRGADLEDADLEGADLRDADLRGTNLRDADLWDAELWDADLRDADLRGTNLRGADLRGADLRGADLRGADLRDAELWDADLRGAKDYSQSHDVFAEIVRQQKVETFTDVEWAAIAQITIHRLCWDAIKNRFPDVMPHIFEVLAEAGWTEWLEYWNKTTKEEK